MVSKKLVQIVARRLSTSARRAADEIHPDYPKFRAQQAHFQIPDGKPVHLKGGAFDGVLYRFTVGLCIVGLGMDFYGFYQLTYPKQS